MLVSIRCTSLSRRAILDIIRLGEAVLWEEQAAAHVHTHIRARVAVTAMSIREREDTKSILNLRGQANFELNATIKFLILEIYCNFSQQARSRLTGKAMLEALLPQKHSLILAFAPTPRYFPPLAF